MTDRPEEQTRRQRRNSNYQDRQSIRREFFVHNYILLDENTIFVRLECHDTPIGTKTLLQCKFIDL